MKEHGILFSAPMVRAILEGRKKQTRRIVKNPDWLGCTTGDCPHSTQAACDEAMAFFAPHPVGTRLWVRETWETRVCADWIQMRYVADAGDRWFDVPRKKPDGWKAEWKPDQREWEAIVRTTRDKVRPSIHMPRWASRITLEVTEVKVERLHQITESDAMQEGMLFLGGLRDFPNDAPWADPGDQAQVGYVGARGAFTWAWDRVNGSESWKSNPWVWAYTFKVIEVKK